MADGLSFVAMQECNTFLFRLLVDCLDGLVGTGARGSLFPLRERGSLFCRHCAPACYVRYDYVADS